MKIWSIAAASLALALCLPASAQSMRTFLLGSPLPASHSQRTITINPDTKWVNVTQGEEIRFVAGATDFAWKFDGPGNRSFDLQQVAPAGVLSRTVTVYVAPLPGRRAQ